MNDILSQVDKYMHEALESRLPQVSKAELEDNGAVFYMNGKNGTAFDWYVNEHFPCFFIFYNDEENLGAVQAILHCNGRLSVYVYGDKGHADPEETVKWYECIHSVFEKYGIGRALWSYKEMDFGLVDAHYDPVRDRLLELK